MPSFYVSAWQNKPKLAWHHDFFIKMFIITEKPVALYMKIFFLQAQTQAHISLNVLSYSGKQYLVDAKNQANSFLNEPAVFIFRIQEKSASRSFLSFQIITKLTNDFKN